MATWNHLRQCTLRFLATSTTQPISFLPRRRTPLSALAPKTDFASFNIHSSITAALTATNINNPTSIQRLSLPPLLSRKNVLLAAETGAGKTLAYLTPLLSHLKRSETSQSPRGSSMQFSTPTMRPSILVLVPTRELTMQVLRVVKALSHVAKFRARAAMGGPNRAALRRTLKDSPVDLLVGTPGAVGKLLDNKLIYLSRVKAVVVDEADALLSEKGGFADQTLPIVDALGRREGVQFVYAGATIPARVQADIKGKHDKLAVVRGEQLHKATSAANLKTTFIRVAGGEDAKFAKAIEIAEKALLQKGGADRLLIFCDERERREKLVDLLREYTGANIVHLCGRNDYQERQRDWESFLGNTVDGEQARIAVCAKSFGRGVDHHGIGTVLLVDVPWTGAEYLHRVGRIRGSGKVFVLVGNREEAVAEALFLGHVKGERLVSIQPRSAWKGYTNAGKDRITSEPAVNYAKRKSQAKWIDERPRAVGTARSGVGNAVLQRPNEDERAHWARHAFARRDQRVRMAPSSASGRWHKSSKKRMGREQKHERGGRMGKFRTTIASNW